MLYHGSQCDRHDGDHGSDQQGSVAVGQCPEGGLIPVNGKSDPCSFRYRCEIHTAKDGCHHIRTDNTDDNRNDLHHSLTPDIADHYQCDSNHSDQPVCGTVVDSGLGQGQTEGNDDGAGNDGREETHYIDGTEALDLQG